MDSTNPHHKRDKKGGGAKNSTIAQHRHADIATQRDQNTREHHCPITKKE